MDERIAQLKYSKKQYKKIRRRAVCGWKFFAWLFFVLGLVCGAAGALQYLPPNPVQTAADTYLWSYLLQLTGIQLQGYALIAAAVCGGLALLMLPGWIAGKARSKKTDAYYNLQTLRNTLKTEKEDRK